MDRRTGTTFKSGASADSATQASCGIKSLTGECGKVVKEIVSANFGDVDEIEFRQRHRDLGRLSNSAFRRDTEASERYVAKVVRILSLPASSLHLMIR